MGRLLNLELNEELHKELKLLAARESRSIKDIVTEQITEYIKVHKEGNPQHLITSSLENEDFLGFPSMATDTKNKKKYLKKMPKEMIEQMSYHIQEWQGFLKKL